jgi:hypothetical protein
LVLVSWFCSDLLVVAKVVVSVRLVKVLELAVGQVPSDLVLAGQLLCLVDLASVQRLYNPLG